MKTTIRTDQLTTRRAFLGSAAALAAWALVPGRALGGEAPLGTSTASGKPCSVFNGVRIGCISYSYRGGIDSAQDTLKALIQDGLSEVELMGGPIESYAGFGGGGGRGRKGGAAKAPAKFSDAQRQEQLAKCRELRKLYNDAGITIHLHKTSFGQSEEEIDFNFQVAKALGCVGITLERSEAMARKLGPFADQHKIWVAFHNHTNNYPVMEKTDPILDYGQYIGFNFDVGHYFAGTKGLSPIPVIEKYHDRIVSLHLKDRTAGGGNLPWGQGKTPVKEILQLMKKEKWTFPADIELEYKVPEGSSSVAEVAKCVQYCREALA
ncbi:MAG TPA: sugar phosphate isomerase/epimerase [Candidatus Sulfotelmatobacter sp.]|nr:sugar phosphate isomerase/epimerase [Candidatus Sulfotelmatobacter sp.]